MEGKRVGAVGVKTKSDDFAFSNNFYLFFFRKKGKFVGGKEWRRKRGKSLFGKGKELEKGISFLYV